MVKNVYVWGLTLFAAFGGFMFGYDIGVINGVKEMKGFRLTFNLSYTELNSSDGAVCSEGVAESTILGLIVSVFSLGCLVGALVAGVLSDWIGRKPSIMGGGAVFIVGGLIQSVSYYLWMILLGRIIAGIGVGILSMVVPVYNAELAPKSLRGSLVSLNQLAITAGIMVSFLINLACQYFLEGWRVALALQVLFGVILIVGMLWLPETPRWLVKKGKDARADKVLFTLRRAPSEEIRKELSEIQSSVKQLSVGGGLLIAGRAFLDWKIIQRVGIGIGLQLFQQFTGMNVIMYYSTSIFCQIGVREYISTALVGALNFFTTILAIFLVDKIGRKALLLLGSLGMMLSMLCAATLVLVGRVGQEDTPAGYVVVLFICFFVFNFAYSWGPVAWVVTSEIFPLNVRAIAVSITTAANWSGNFVVAMLTPIMLASSLKIHGTFYVISVALLMSFIYVLCTLPETKGKSLERIDELFSLPWLKRTNIFYYLRCGCPWHEKCGRASSEYSIREVPQASQDLATDNENEDDEDKRLLKQSTSETSSI